MLSNDNVTPDNRPALCDANTGTDEQNAQVTLTLLTFSALQPHTRAFGDVVGGVTLEAVGGTSAEAAVIGAGLAAPLLGVVEGLGTGGHTLTLKQVALHPKLICGGKFGEVNTIKQRIDSCVFSVLVCFPVFECRMTDGWYSWREDRKWTRRERNRLRGQWAQTDSLGGLIGPPWPLPRTQAILCK